MSGFLGITKHRVTTMKHESVEFDASDVEPEVTALIEKLGELCQKHKLPFVVSVLYRRKKSKDGVDMSFTGATVMPAGKTPFEHYVMQAVVEGELEAAAGGMFQLSQRGKTEQTTEIL
jgi:hypothetical protein